MTFYQKYEFNLKKRKNSNQIFLIFKILNANQSRFKLFIIHDFAGKKFYANILFLFPSFSTPHPLVFFFLAFLYLFSYYFYSVPWSSNFNKNWKKFQNLKMLDLIWWAINNQKLLSSPHRLLADSILSYFYIIEKWWRHQWNSLI